VLPVSIITATSHPQFRPRRPARELIASMPAPPTGEPRPTSTRLEEELYVGEVRDAVMPRGLVCPRCGGKAIVRYGKRGSAQRYMCRECERTFTDLTGTVLHGLRRRDLWLEFCKCLMEGLTVRETANRLGVSKNTSFEWRHRAIAALASADEAEKCQGLVELTHRPMLRCFKGSRVPAEANMQHVKPTFRRHHRVYGSFIPASRLITMVVAVDRAGRARAAVARRGEIVTPMLSTMVVSDAQVCAPAFGNRFRFGAGWPGGLYFSDEYRGFRSTVGRVDVGPLYHVRNANRLIHCFEEWMRRFCGVATKYVLRYFSWYLRRATLAAASPAVAAKLLFFEVLGTGPRAIRHRQ